MGLILDLVIYRYFITTHNFITIFAYQIQHGKDIKSNQLLMTFIKFHLTERFKKLTQSGMDSKFIKQLAIIISKMLEADPNDRISSEELIKEENCYGLFEGLDKDYKDKNYKHLLNRSTMLRNDTDDLNFLDKNITKYCCKAILKMENDGNVMKIAKIDLTVGEMQEIFISNNDGIEAEFIEELGFGEKSEESDDYDDICKWMVDRLL